MAAAVWVGGTIALVFVAVPPAQRLEGEARARQLRELGRRWRPLGWSALGVAVITGIAIAVRKHAYDGAPRDFDWVLAVKGLLVGLLVAGAYLLVVAGSLAGAAFTGRALLFGSCDLSALRPIALGQNSFLYTSDGSLLGVVPSRTNRQPLKLSHMSSSLPKATVAIEDRRFW